MELLSTHSHNNKNNQPLLPFVIPYHREHRHIKNILDRNWYLIENDSQLQLIFSTKHFLSYKRNPQHPRSPGPYQVYTQGKKDPKRQVQNYSSHHLAQTLAWCHTESRFIRYQRKNPPHTLAHRIESRVIQILSEQTLFP